MYFFFTKNYYHLPMKKQNIQKLLKEHGIKITPQRKIILGILFAMNNHPTAEMIIREVTLKEPNISPGTVYKTLDLLVEKGIIHKIKTEKDIMRYDPFIHRHHHLYIRETDEIIDYEDEDLNRLLESFFSKKNIPGFRVEDFRLEITARQNEQK